LKQARDKCARLQQQVEKLELQVRDASMNAEKERGSWSADKQQLQSQVQSQVNTISELNEEINDVLKAWKNVAAELNKLKAQDQGFLIVTDRDLIDRAKPLRAAIRNFAVQYFDGQLSKEVTFNRDSSSFQYLEGAAQDYTAYIRSSFKCPSIIQAFIWSVLKNKVLDKYRWAGARSLEMQHLVSTLRKPIVA
jgi:hypothetical protein